jgi:hypothetical protein
MKDWQEFYGILICVWVVFTMICIYELGNEE